MHTVLRVFIIVHVLFKSKQKLFFSVGDAISQDKYHQLLFIVSTNKKIMTFVL